MKKVVALSMSAILATGLSACAAEGGPNKQDVGVLTGAAVGGLLGSQFGQGSGQVAATLGGAVLGGLLGGSIGKTMDDADRMRMNHALESSPTNHTTAWSNPDNGNHYSVTPLRTYTRDSGQPCREYSTVATIGGKRQEIYGTACRQADGSWKVVK
jgi:surface antigen